LPPAASIICRAASRVSEGRVPVRHEDLAGDGAAAAVGHRFALAPGDAGGAQLLDHFAVVGLAS
jgi:hypothetical protein